MWVSPGFCWSFTRLNQSISKISVINCLFHHFWLRFQERKSTNKTHGSTSRGPMKVSQNLLNGFESFDVSKTAWKLNKLDNYFLCFCCSVLLKRLGGYIRDFLGYHIPPHKSLSWPSPMKLKSGTPVKSSLLLLVSSKKEAVFLWKTNVERKRVRIHVYYINLCIYIYILYTVDPYVKKPY